MCVYMNIYSYAIVNSKKGDHEFEGAQVRVPRRIWRGKSEGRNLLIKI